MTYTRVHRSATPPSPASPVRAQRSKSRSRSRSRSRSPVKPRRSRSRSADIKDAKNPGNNLYVTGLSTRVTSADLEKFFSKEGKVADCQLVTDPRSRESRGFAFVTMDTIEDADRCIKYLDRAVLEGRIITVEKAKRKRGRTPTPGKYQGLRERHGRRRSRSYSPRRHNDKDPYRRDRRGRSHSPRGRNEDDHGSHRRRRDRSGSAGGNRYSRDSH